MEGDSSSSTPTPTPTPTPTGDQATGSSSSNSRWNPTKEQINMLENLYKQGVRTPNAEQIQQITSRLRAFGYIEGKNVFYWFQNHKARQRQKQKQESLAYFNRFIHNNTPVASPHHRVYSPYCHLTPSHDVTCGAAYYDLPPQNEMGYFQQSQLQQNMVLPRSNHNKITRSPSSSFANYASYGNNFPMQTTGEPTIPNSQCTNNHHETLCLFPMHPTGILQGRSRIDDNNSSTSSTTTTVIDNDRHQDQFSGVKTGFLDFFSTGQNRSFVTD